MDSLLQHSSFRLSSSFSNQLGRRIYHYSIPSTLFPSLSIFVSYRCLLKTFKPKSPTTPSATNAGEENTMGWGGGGVRARENATWEQSAPQCISLVGELQPMLWKFGFQWSVVPYNAYCFHWASGQAHGRYLGYLFCLHTIRQNLPFFLFKEELRRRSFLPSCITLWNSLPLSITSCSSSSSFLSRLDSHFESDIYCFGLWPSTKETPLH